MVFRDRLNHVTSRIIEEDTVVDDPSERQNINKNPNTLNSSSSDDPRLVFEFIVTQKTLLVLQHFDQPEILIGDEESPIKRKPFRINPRYAESSNTVETIVALMLTDLEIEQNMHACLIEKISPDAFAFTKRAIESKPRRMMMQVEIVIVDVYEYYDEGETSAEMESAQDDDEARRCGFVPASKLAIEKMEKVRFNGEDSAARNCIICFEDMEIGSEVTRMPCSHVFHGSCLTSWLEINHVCPLCRFEMPI